MAVRKTISGVEAPPVGEILKTNILTMLSQLFNFPDTCEEVRVMKVSEQTLK